MTTIVNRPPKDLNSFFGKKWLERLTASNSTTNEFTDLEFLILTTNKNAPNARTLTAGSNITFQDNGAGDTLVIDISSTGITAGTFTKITVDAKGRATAGQNATTDDIAEGLNLYFTTARVLAALPQDIDTTDSPTFNVLTLTELDTADCSVKAGSSTGYIAKAGGVIFDHYADVGNVGTGEDDLYSDTIPANVLANNGEKLCAEYMITLASSATATKQMKAYFAGTEILDSGALTYSAGGTAKIMLTITRVSSSIVRVCATFSTSGVTLQPIVTYTSIGSLTLSGTNILKITGEAAGVGAATDDIIARTGFVEWKAAA